MAFWWEQESAGRSDPKLAAVIFDVDGTLAETERDGHRPAFNEAFAIHGLEINWDADEYGRLLEIAGGQRRIAAHLRERGFGDASDDLAADVHRTKTELFRGRVLAGDLMPRPGLRGLLTSLADEGIRIAVATTGRRAWVEPLLSQILDRGIVETVVTGDDVSRLEARSRGLSASARRVGYIADECAGGGGFADWSAGSQRRRTGNDRRTQRLHGESRLHRGGDGAGRIRWPRASRRRNVSTAASAMVVSPKAGTVELRRSVGYALRGFAVVPRTTSLGSSTTSFGPRRFSSSISTANCTACRASPSAS